jgi:hypothetical protein
MVSLFPYIEVYKETARIQQRYFRRSEQRRLKQKIGVYMNAMGREHSNYLDTFLAAS